MPDICRDDPRRVSKDLKLDKYENFDVLPVHKKIHLFTKGGNQKGSRHLIIITAQIIWLVISCAVIGVTLIATLKTQIRNKKKQNKIKQRHQWLESKEDRILRINSDSFLRQQKQEDAWGIWGSLRIIYCNTI